VSEIPMPAFFNDLSQRDQQAYRVLAAWASDRGLGYAETRTSAVFTLPKGRRILWFFGPTAKPQRELEFDLRTLPQSDARGTQRAVGSIGGSATATYPNVPRGTIARRWEELRASVLEPYLDAWQRVGV
jgi:hypothetical protein